MSERERRPFEVKVGNKDYALELGRCAVVLFYQQSEVDYIAVDVTEPGDEETSTLRIFNSPMMARWMAGTQPSEQGFHNITLEVDGEDKRFRELYGWSPATIIKEQPTEEELEYFMDVNTRSMEQEWSNWEEDEQQT